MSTVTSATATHASDTNSAPAMTLRNPMGWLYAFVLASVMWMVLFGSVAAIAHAMTH